LLGHEHLAKTPVLVFANKQDLRDAMSVADLTESLNLHSIKDHDWHIQASCAVSGARMARRRQRVVQLLPNVEPPDLHVATGAFRD
jgi:signal recognition particle receptor subunit beta